MFQVSFTMRADGSFVVYGQDSPTSEVYSLAAGHVIRNQNNTDLEIPKCVLSERGAERAPIERRRLLGLSARNLFRLVTG